MTRRKNKYAARKPTLDHMIQIRVFSGDAERWNTCAVLAGLSTSAWIRSVCNSYVKTQAVLMNMNPSAVGTRRTSGEADGNVIDMMTRTAMPHNMVVQKHAKKGDTSERNEGNDDAGKAAGEGEEVQHGGGQSPQSDDGVRGQHGGAEGSAGRGDGADGEAADGGHGEAEVDEYTWDG